MPVARATDLSVSQAADCSVPNCKGGEQYVIFLHKLSLINPKLTQFLPFPFLFLPDAVGSPDAAAEGYDQEFKKLQM